MEKHGGGRGTIGESRRRVVITEEKEGEQQQNGRRVGGERGEHKGERRGGKGLLIRLGRGDGKGGWGGR